jgi:Phospholipase_D-nuclease N-terminal
MELLTPSLGLIFWILFWFLLWLIALIDVLGSDFKGQNEKLIWVLVIIFIPFLGPVLYLIIGRKNRIKFNQN